MCEMHPCKSERGSVTQRSLWFDVDVQGCTAMRSALWDRKDVQWCCAALHDCVKEVPHRLGVFTLVQGSAPEASHRLG